MDGSATGVKVHPAVLRLELIKSHYRSNMNFTKKGLQDSANVVRRLTEFRKKLEAAAGGATADVSMDHPILKAFGEALADDLNFSKAIAAVLPWATTDPENPAEALAVLNKINEVLAVAPLGDATAATDDDFDVAAKCKAMDDARAAKDWGTSDALRAELEAAGYDVKSTPDGTVAEKKLA